jgi:hypothetical protein
MPIWAIDLDGLEHKLKNWNFDVTIVKDQNGNTVNVIEEGPGKKYDGGPVQTRYFETIQEKNKSGDNSFSERQRVGDGNVKEADKRQFPNTANPHDKSNLDQQNQNSGLTRTTSGSVVKKSESPATSANQNNPTITITLYSSTPDKLTDKQIEDRSKVNESTKQKEIERNKDKKVVFQEAFIVDPNQAKNTEIFGILKEEGEVKSTPEELEQKIIKRNNEPGDE